MTWMLMHSTALPAPPLVIIREQLMDRTFTWEIAFLRGVKEIACALMLPPTFRRFGIVDELPILIKDLGSCGVRDRFRAVCLKQIYILPKADCTNRGNGVRIIGEVAHHPTDLISKVSTR